MSPSAENDAVVQPVPLEKVELIAKTSFESHGNQHKILGYRHAIHLWLFAAYTVSYILRNIINVAIVSMVGRHSDNDTMTHVTNHSNQSLPETCPYPEGQRNETILQYSKGEFDWSHATQGFILSAFYYSYITTQFIGGYMVYYVGARRLMAISISACSVCTLLHPFAANLGSGYLAFVRIVHGFADGFCFPVGHFVISQWAPRHERTILASIAWSGSNIGTMISAFGTGFFCEYGFGGGWPSAFYVFGVLGLLWCIGWLICVRDSPAHHPRIRHNERKYIEHHSEPSDGKPLPFTQVPWKQFATSAPFWGVILAHLFATWSYYTPLVEVPTYLKEILHMRPSWTGVLTCIPYLLQFVLAHFSAFLSDFLIAKGAPVGLVRKLIYCIGSFSSAVSLALVSYVGCSVQTVVILLCTGIGMWGFTQTGFIVNYFDIAPQYASIMFGISNTFAVATGIISPLLTGYLTNEESSIQTWSTVFLLMAFIPVVGAAVFVILGSGEVQPWANSSPDQLSKSDANMATVELNSSVNNGSKKTSSNM